VILIHHSQLDVEALVAAVRALESLARGRTSDRLKQPADDVFTAQLPPEGGVLPYDPASVFLLETMVSIAGQTTDHIEELWCAIIFSSLAYNPTPFSRPIIFGYLSSLLSSTPRFSILLVERAVVALLRLCRIIATRVGG
jgi:golgi-specific brefeldin A-resistance guanine nucleotide exchange factor 1